MHYRADYVTRLAAMGAPVTPDRVVSSARATAPHWRAFDGIRRVPVVGERPRARMPRRGPQMSRQLHAATLSSAPREGLNGWDAAGGPDAVVVGLDPQFTLREVNRCRGLYPARGPFRAFTNRDPWFISDLS